MQDFMNSGYGKAFFRDVQKIADSLEKIAKEKDTTTIHDHRIGAANRISEAVGYLDDCMKQLDYERKDLPGEDVYTILEAVRKLLLKSA